jgi:hypothetical protein
MYSSEYTSGFSGPAASHLAALLRLVTNVNIGQAPVIQNNEFRTAGISMNTLRANLEGHIMHFCALAVDWGPANAILSYYP